MTKGDKIKYIGSGELRGCEGEFVNYTNKTKTRCRYTLKTSWGDGIGFTGLVDNLKLVGA